MNLPTLRQLQFLVAIADHGGFSAAADALGVTQPTLSSAMRELEALLGHQLVERGRAGASLTPTGEECVDRARRMLGDAEDMVLDTRGSGAPLSGIFRLGAIPTIAPFVLPQALSALRQGYPDLKLYLREDLSARLVEGLRARTLDAALIALPYDAPGLEAETLVADEFVLVAPQGHALLSRNGLSPEDLKGESLLLLEDGHCLRDHAIASCQLSDQVGHGRSDISATSLHTLVQMVAGGLGISLVPRLATRPGAPGHLTDGMAVGVRAFTQPIVGRSIGIVWRKGSARAAEARLIGQTIKTLLSAL
jgi:LysR family hydrogen peroxide-inducible transcriptional activator